MSKLYFKYGAMGCSKSASALMCRFNYLQKGMKVLMLKPSIDSRWGSSQITSRIGLSAPCKAIGRNENIKKIYLEEKAANGCDVIIVDEVQFCTKEQVDQLKEISCDIPVLGYGLKNNFKNELFEGSKRMIELSESLMEIKSICKCGAKATCNARLVDGHIVTEGEEILLGADETYEGMCYSCYEKLKKHS